MPSALLEPCPALHQQHAETASRQDRTQRHELQPDEPTCRAARQDRQQAGLSPRAGAVLLEQIAPRLRATIPHVVRPTGSEDTQELWQDAVTMAAQMLHSLEARDKEVTVGNVCYYVTLLMKSGRRSQSANRTDALSPGAALDGKSRALSLEDPVGLCPETGEAVSMGELLAGTHEDPASTAARNLDWAGFLDGHDARYPAMLRCAVAGQPMNSLGGKPGASNSALSARKRQLAGDIRAFMGEDVLREVCQRPRWQAQVEGEEEQMRCRHERHCQGR